MVSTDVFGSTARAAPESHRHDDSNPVLIPSLVAVDAGGAELDFPPWSLTIIATLDGFNDMDSVEVFRWQRDGLEVYG
jgi:hypothetical protein